MALSRWHEPAGFVFASSCRRRALAKKTGNSDVGALGNVEASPHSFSTVQRRCHAVDITTSSCVAAGACEAAGALLDSSWISVMSRSSCKEGRACENERRKTLLKGPLTSRSSPATSSACARSAASHVAQSRRCAASIASSWRAIRARTRPEVSPGAVAARAALACALAPAATA